MNNETCLNCGKRVTADSIHTCSPQKGKTMRKVSIQTVENTIGLARSVADGTTKFPFMGYCADLMEKMLEEIKMLRLQADELTEAGGVIGVLREKVSLQADYITQLEKGLESSIEMNKAQAERQNK